MSEARQFHPELLRPVNYICTPDPRSVGFATLDRELGDFRQLRIDDYHKYVAAHNLNASVPEDIAVHFDTARNLYIYAWFIYRFFPVAEHHALACLEFALRVRYEKEIPKKYCKNSKYVTLKPLLRYAVDKGDIKNEGFKRWHRAAETRARTRYMYDKVKETAEQGVDQLELDYSEAKVTDIDKNIGYIDDLVELLPELRNYYAHGTDMLHNQVLGTIEVVSEIINQIYPDTGTTDD